MSTNPTRKMPFQSALIILFTLLITACSKPDSETVQADTGQPNILLIVADDLGYTDLGVFGSEIHTPNLDSLARDGQLFSHFYSASMCSPARAMLLSGMDNHRAGVGNLFAKTADNQRGQIGYEGHLTERVASLPELLLDSGYHTYMSGKWHLGDDEEHSPAAKGFEKSFVLAESGAGHFSNRQSLSGPGPAIYRENGKQLDSLPEDFYSTRFYAERMIDYIEQDRDDNKPFFAYLAFSAVHFPLQAPAASIEKYAGRYDQGYEVLHEQRLSRLKDLGFITSDAQTFPLLPGEKPWNELTLHERQVASRKMEIYAAMIDDLDSYVGKVIDHLKSIGEYDNTLIFFMSDNGAEGHRLEDGLLPLLEWSKHCCDNSYENMGNPDSYVMLGPNWARASVGPFRMFKGFTSEGGIRVPAFIHYPAALPVPGLINETLSVMDVMPTLLDFAAVKHPGSEFSGRQVLPLQGRSLSKLLNGESGSMTDNEFSMGWELLGKRAYRKGNWKIIWQPPQQTWEPWVAGIKSGQWQLYDLSGDIAEMHDLSDQYPQKLNELISLWENYVEENGVILPDRIFGY